MGRVQSSWRPGLLAELRAAEKREESGEKNRTYLNVLQQTPGGLLEYHNVSVNLLKLQEFMLKNKLISSHYFNLQTVDPQILVRLYCRLQFTVSPHILNYVYI